MQIRNATRWLSVSTLAGVGTLLGSQAAFAAGFALRNQSASGMGSGLASDTVNTYDASGLASNPAIMSAFTGHHFSFNLNNTDANINAKNAAGTHAPGTAVSRPVSGEQNVDNVSDDVNIPYIYGIHQINEQAHVGWSFTVPYGTNTDYGDTWAGRYHATRTDLKTYDFSVHGSYKINELVAVGLTATWEQAEGVLASAADIGSKVFAAQVAANGALGAPNPALIGTADSIVKYKGDSEAFGFGFGVLVKPMEGSRLGLSYKAAVKHEAKGDLTFNPANPTGTAMLATVRGTAAAAQVSDSSDAKLELELPQIISLGYAHDITDFTVFANFTQTMWSSFEELTPKWNGQQSVTELNWKDSSFFAIGGEYRLNPELTLRAGVGMDKSVVGDTDRTPRTPDNDRTTLSLGAGYKTGQLVLNAGIQKIFVEDADINLKANAYADNNGRGDLTTKMTIDPLILMLSAGYTL